MPNQATVLGHFLEIDERMISGGLARRATGDGIQDSVLRSGGFGLLVILSWSSGDRLNSFRKHVLLEQYNNHGRH